MSESERYTDRDAEQFAALTPNSDARPAAGGRKAAPHSRTQGAQTYTPEDLEKFQKMFSAGFAPDPDAKWEKPERSSSDKPGQRKAKQPGPRSASGGSDTKLVQRSAPRQASREVSKGGRIARQKGGDPYAQRDQEQFDALTAGLEAGLRDRKKSDATMKDDRPGATDRKWRFPELHDATRSVLSQASESTRFSRSNLKRPGEGRIKLGYFD